MAALAEEADDAGTLGVYGPGATEPSRASDVAPAAGVGRRLGLLGRAQGEPAGADEAPVVGLSAAAAAAPAAAAAAPVVAAPGVTDVRVSAVGVDAVGVDAVSAAPSAESDADGVADVALSPNAPVRAPAAVAGPDFFRPRRSSSDFFGGVPPTADDPAAVVGVGAGPGCGDGTGEAEEADRGAEEAEAAEAPVPAPALVPDSGPRPATGSLPASEVGPVAEADDAERAE